MGNTEKLANDLQRLEQHSTELETKVDHLEAGLQTACNRLEKAKAIQEKLEDLDSGLETAAGLLNVVRIIPAISVSASNARRMIIAYRKPVKKAAKIAKEAEEKIKPVREDLEKIKEGVAKVDEQFVRVIDTEQQMSQSLAHAQSCVSSIPKGLVRNESVKSLDVLAGEAGRPVVTADAGQVLVLKQINDFELHMEKIEHDLKALLGINVAIDEVMEVLKPFVAALENIKKVFSHVIRVPYGGYPKMCKKKVWGVRVQYPCGWKTVYFKFRIQQILDGITGVAKPIMDLLDKAMGAALNPLLKALNLNIKLPKIPGLEDLNRLLRSIVDIGAPLEKAIASLRAQAAKAQRQLESAFAYLDPLQKVYDDCIAYQGANKALEVRGKSDLAAVDPELFDAMCFKGRAAFIFKGEYFWRQAGGKKESEPTLIRGKWGMDGKGKPIEGPFSAVCLHSDTFYFFRGRNYWTSCTGKGGGPYLIKGKWGTGSDRRAITGPIDAACEIDNNVVLFKGLFYWVTSPGANRAKGPFPIKGAWGRNKAKQPLNGPFDAVARKGQVIYIRKDKRHWEQRLAQVRKSLGRVATVRKGKAGLRG